MFADAGDCGLEEFPVVRRKLNLDRFANRRPLLHFLNFDADARQMSRAFANFSENFNAFAVTLVLIVQLDEEAANAAETVARGAAGQEGVGVQPHDSRHLEYFNFHFGDQFVDLLC